LTGSVDVTLRCGAFVQTLVKWKSNKCYN